MISVNPYSPYRLPGCKKVLVVEDMEMNQLLMKKIMESWGIEVAIVANGLLAVEKVQQENYDLILMDIQMPEMDGVEATRRIRQLTDECKATTPIVAVTANLLKGDSERYIAAGMNDYIAKPIEEKKLFSILYKNFCPGKTNGGIDETNQFVPDPDNALYDLTLVKAISGGDESFVKSMILLFLETVPSIMEQMQLACKQRDWQLTSKLAHKLKSTIDSLNIYQLQDLIRKIESDGKKEENLDQVPGCVRLLNKGMNDCMAQVKSDFRLD
jgi:CheY-like chemotaxis protein